MKWTKVLLLSFLFFLAVFPQSFLRDLWEPDEPRFALVAREMIQTGDFVMPHRNNKPYPDKPPLFFWAIALSSLATGGVNTSAAMLPSAMAGAFLVFLVFCLARRLTEDDDTALLSALILATSFKIFWQASHAQIDMLLALLTTVAMYGYTRLEAGGGKRNVVLAWAAMAFATLAKGPVGFILPVGAMLVYRRWSGRRRYRELFAIAGVGVFLGIVGCWLVLLIVQGLRSGQSAYLENILFKQTVVRFAKSWHHYQPVYYFFKVILYDFFPWSPFLVSLIILKFKKMEFSDTEKFLFSWVLFILLFFSIPMGKRGLYILPLYPAAAILVAGFFRNRPEGKWFSLPVKIVALFYGLLGVVFMAKGSLSFPGISSVSLLWPGLACIGAAFWVFFKRGHPIVPMVAAQLMLFLTAGYWVMPVLNQNNSAKPFVRKNMTFLDAGSKIAIAQYRSAHVFYGDRNLVEFPGISESDNIVTFVSYLEKTPDSFGILSRNWATRLKEMGIPVDILNERRVGNKKLCFIRILK
ncbi:MAG: glycosyltransferase family 39 protein [Acidobacteria bacterium]|nr:glycosyltransferase family 39 protein [Acidobacteriota bacterium]